MPGPLHVRPKYQADAQIDRDLIRSARQVESYKAAHEGATETAFSHLLATTASSQGWLPIPKQPHKINGKTIFPDGTLRDLLNLARGYWEAKDTNDDLDDEIQKKIKSKYPLTNIIFEDTRQAVLFQNRKPAARFDLPGRREHPRRRN